MRAALAWADHNTLPYPGGVMKQPYNLWRAMEEINRGLSASRSAIAKLRTEEIMRQMRG